MSITIADKILEATRAVPLVEKGVIESKVQRRERKQKAEVKVKITLPESLGEGFRKLFED